MSKVIFFTSGQFPTPQEKADIDALNAGNVEIVVRSKTADGQYGTDRLEPCDFVYKNANIPTAYAGVPTIVNPHIAPTQAVVSHNVDMVLPVTGTYATKIKATVVNGVITGFVLS